MEIIILFFRECVEEEVKNCLVQIQTILERQPDSIILQDLLASAHFWLFILQYSQDVDNQKYETNDISNDYIEENGESVDGVSTWRQVGTLGKPTDIAIFLKC